MSIYRYGGSVGFGGIKRKRADSNNSSNALTEESFETSCLVLNKIDFTMFGAPLSIVFQFVPTKDLLSQVSHSSKQFYRVSKNPNSWRYSSFSTRRLYLTLDVIHSDLQHLPMLRRLDLSGLHLGWSSFDLSVKNLDLSYLDRLESLDLHSNNLGREGCLMVVEKLQHLTELNSLDLGDNSLGEPGCQVIAQNL